MAVRFVLLLLVIVCSALSSCEKPDINNSFDDEPTTPMPEPEPDPDSLAFASKYRTELKLQGAKGFVIKDKVFDAPQNISVITISPTDFKITPMMGEGTSVYTASTYGKESDADFVINACYWSVNTGKPTSYIKINGVVVSTKTLSSYYPRVNGLLYMYDDHIEIVQSYDYPDYPGLTHYCDNIIACGPVLMDNGKPCSFRHIIESTEESMQSKISFYTTRHPRSIIGRNAENEIFFVVVDGRANGNAEGMTIEELTQMCRWLGMTEAMNLDGGGSSTLWSKELGVVNYPCDNKKFDHEGERKVKSVITAKSRPQ